MKIKLPISTTFLPNQQRNLSLKVAKQSPRRPVSKEKALEEDLWVTKDSNWYLKNKVAKVSNEINNGGNDAVDISVDKFDKFGCWQ